MNRNQYVFNLPDELFCKVYKAIKEVVSDETDIALALDSKVYDLEDTIDLKALGFQKGSENMQTYKLFCTVTMKSYTVKADSEREAIEKLARELGYSKNTIDVFR